MATANATVSFQVKAGKCAYTFGTNVVKVFATLLDRFFKQRGLGSRPLFKLITTQNWTAESDGVMTSRLVGFERVVFLLWRWHQIFDGLAYV